MLELESAFDMKNSLEGTLKPRNPISCLPRVGVMVGAMVGAMTVFSASGSLAAEVNLYSSRQPFLIDPLIEAFTAKTGIKVNSVYMKKGMLERLKAEGQNSPADLILTADIGNLNNHVEAGLLQPTQSRVLETNVPASYRHPDGLWYGLTTRARVIFAHKDRVKEGEVSSYEDLARPGMKGRGAPRASG